MGVSEVAERAVATERELSDAEAWELRYNQEAAVNQDLRISLLKAQAMILALRERVVELEGERLEDDRRALFARLDLRSGDELVLRDGKHILISAPEKSEPSDGAAGTIVPSSGGAPAEADDNGGASGE